MDVRRTTTTTSARFDGPGSEPDFLQSAAQLLSAGGGSPARPWHGVLVKGGMHAVPFSGRRVV